MSHKIQAKNCFPVKLVELFLPQNEDYKKQKRENLKLLEKKVKDMRTY